VLQLRDLLNYRIQASDGSFGRVSDVVFDRNGNAMYLLGSYQGQIYPLPFTRSPFSAMNNTLSFNVPISTLQQMAINPQNLPTMSNQAFVSRMQQVFGSSFGATTSTSSYPTTGTSSTTAGATTGTTGTTNPFGTTGSTATVQPGAVNQLSPNATTNSTSSTPGTTSGTTANA